MRLNQINLTVFAALLLLITACNSTTTSNNSEGQNSEDEISPMKAKVEQYATVELTAEINHLSDNEKEMLRVLFQAADLMDEVFWMQNAGQKEEFLKAIDDTYAKRFAEINYGAWDEMDNLKPFLPGFGPKPKGAGFYPSDITEEEFAEFDNPDKTSLYTLIRRNDDGSLKTVWYHKAFADQVNEASELLKKASELSDDKEFANYLKLRAEALLTDDYQPSDMAWLDVKNSNVDLVIGPIENYTDQFKGYKAAHESFILIKDKVWSDRLSKYAQFLPQLQTELPVDPKYKSEVPGADADLNAYDVVYYAGDCNMAGKTIAINLPNDEEVQLKKGTRKLQLKNAMRAKFDHILIPIAEKLIAEEQQEFITFDAFFSNTMFHEVAHGMGIKNTINNKGTVRHALKEQYSAIEEGKADILGLFLVTRLHEMGEFSDTKLMDNYVTFMAGIFRSVRFGAASAHGKANMIRFNYFKEQGAFAKNESGKYAIDMDKMKEASANLTSIILELQGNGDYDAAQKMVKEMGVIPADLQTDLDLLETAGIPLDIVFDQGLEKLGL